jgi:hypothetical protein
MEQIETNSYSLPLSLTARFFTAMTRQAMTTLTLASLFGLGFDLLDVLGFRHNSKEKAQKV